MNVVKSSKRPRLEILKNQPHLLTTEELCEIVSSASPEVVEAAASSSSVSPALCPIFSTFLSSGSRRLRDASAVGLGHIALGEGALVLKKQEVFKLLISKIHEYESGAYFYALYHILRTSNPSESLMKDLSSYCVKNLGPKSPLELYWLAFGLSSRGNLHLVLAPIIPAVFEILVYEIFQKSDPRPLVKIVTPLVRLLGNLCATTEGPALIVLGQPDLAAILTTLLSTNYLHLVRETLWFFGNLVNNDSVLVQEEFVKLDLMDRMEYHISQAVKRVYPFGVTHL